jgi:thioredoxin-related protein
VDLYSQYQGRVQFVVIDLDRKQSPAQKELVKKYFTGSIPHVVVLDRSGKAVYNAAGEVQENILTTILDKALK